jgi:hypothetical protein
MSKRLYVVLTALVALGGIGFGATAPAHAADKLENIPHTFKPTITIASRGPLDLKGLEGARLQVDAFTDNRENPGFIGQNRDKIPARKVTTQENVARFVTYQVKTLLAGQGVPIVESGGTVIMKGWVKRFFADETNRYNGEVELELSFVDAASGKVLWSFMTSGNSSRYGISYKADNYYEVLSDSLIGAVHELLRNPKFKAVLAQKPQ